MKSRKRELPPVNGPYGRDSSEEWKPTVEFIIGRDSPEWTVNEGSEVE